MDLNTSNPLNAEESSDPLSAGGSSTAVNITDGGAIFLPPINTTDPLEP